MALNEFDDLVKELEAYNKANENKLDNESEEASESEASKEDTPVINQGLSDFRNKETLKKVLSYKKKKEELTLLEAYEIFSIDAFPVDRDMLRQSFYRMCLETCNESEAVSILTSAKELIEESININPFLGVSEDEVEKPGKKKHFQNLFKRRYVSALGDFNREKEEADEGDIKENLPSEPKQNPAAATAPEKRVLRKNPALSDFLYERSQEKRKKDHPTFRAYRIIVITSVVIVLAIITASFLEKQGYNLRDIPEIFKENISFSLDAAHEETIEAPVGSEPKFKPVELLSLKQAQNKYPLSEDLISHYGYMKQSDYDKAVPGTNITVNHSFVYTTNVAEAKIKVVGNYDYVDYMTDNIEDAFKVTNTSYYVSEISADLKGTWKGTMTLNGDPVEKATMEIVENKDGTVTGSLSFKYGQEYGVADFNVITQLESQGLEGKIVTLTAENLEWDSQIKNVNIRFGAKYDVFKNQLIGYNILDSSTVNQDKIEFEFIKE